MALNLLSIDQAVTSLLACACEALSRIPGEVPGLSGCPCRTCAVPGTPAADGCDEGCTPLPEGEYPGQLTVNVVRMYPTDRHQFPREVVTVRDNGSNCTTQTLAVELAVTLFRCAPMPTDEGCPPTCEQLGASALQLHADMMALQQGVLCCYAGTDTTRRRGRRYVLGTSRTLGPQGGCVGVEQRVTVALDDCVLCPPEAVEGPA